MTGVAANHSMDTGQPIEIDDLVPDIGEPDYPDMPSNQAPLPLPDGVRSPII